MIRWLQRNHHKLRVWPAFVGEFTNALGKKICKIRFFCKKRRLILKKCETFAKIKKKGANTVGQDVQKKHCVLCIVDSPWLCGHSSYSGPFREEKHVSRRRPSYLTTCLHTYIHALIHTCSNIYSSRLKGQASR